MGRAKPLFLLPPIPDWHGDALCAETSPEAFFPERGESTRPAKTICGLCTVRAECLEEALSLSASVGKFGVWGGLSERERRRLQRGRAAA